MRNDDDAFRIKRQKNLSKDKTAPNFNETFTLKWTFPSPLFSSINAKVVHGTLHHNQLVHVDSQQRIPKCFCFYSLQKIFSWSSAIRGINLFRCVSLGKFSKIQRLYFKCKESGNIFLRDIKKDWHINSLLFYMKRRGKRLEFRLLKQSSEISTVLYHWEN